MHRLVRLVVPDPKCFAEVALPLPISTLFTYRVPQELQTALKVGQTVLVPVRSQFLSGVVVRLADHNPSSLSHEKFIKEIKSIENSDFILPNAYLELARWIAERYACSWGEALALLSKPSNRLKRKSFSEGTDQTSNQSPKALSYNLTPEQTAACHAINASIHKNERDVFLLFGVTSSGKTEVYLNAIEAAVQQKKQALFLVPEISLCAPFLKVLRERFGGRVGVWHSQVRTSEKRDFIESIRKGETDIVVGARSALFVPFERLGAIILDEEHDTSYKQDEKPRYHAREAAIRLAELTSCVVVLGSATPSLETFYRAQKGEFKLLELPNRVPSQISPAIHIVDKKSLNQKNRIFSKPLVEAVSKAILRREQVIIALNRRGYSTFLLCTSCGFVWQCANCNLAFIYHAGENGSGHLQCHYCFHIKEMPQACEECKSQALHFGGCGTQKVAQELKVLFPFARVLRLDRDVAKKRLASEEVYKKFKEESADILVGTQMVVQGFDFPRVTLVGVVDADTALHHPDFRASEKTFQWISQSAGRAGRNSIGGTVIVQTMLGEHYCLRAAQTLNYRSFFEKEIEFRKELGYPPFSKLILLRLESSKKEMAAKEAERLFQWIKSKLGSIEGVKILGPGPSPKELLRKLTRWQMLIKCQNDGILSQMVSCAQAFTPKANVRLVIDVDPCQIL